VLITWVSIFALTNQCLTMRREWKEPSARVEVMKE
jgi:hypothetical protein